jgi:shikimate dehydrogenase
MAGRDCLNCDLALMPEGGWVFDMVSNPADTPLTTRGARARAAVVTGLEMLVEQAATSFKLMFGQGSAARPRCRTVARLKA